MNYLYIGSTHTINNTTVDYLDQWLMQQITDLSTQINFTFYILDSHLLCIRMQRA